MTINKEFLDRKTNITAKIVADSISEAGDRVTTFELEYNRYIHSEFMTHRMMSRNCSSSRAIPIDKMIGYTQENMAVPLYFGKNQSGMQAKGEIKNKKLALFVWKTSFKLMKLSAKILSKLGMHKQIPNRLLESFQMVKVVVTTTDMDNFLNLRYHQDAQPEILMLAHKMKVALDASVPKVLKAGQWHLPYVETLELSNTPTFGGNINDQHYFLNDSEGNNLGEIYLEDAIKISTASCAAQSYRTESMTLKKAKKIYDMLIKADVVHSSPFEHIATPVKEGAVEPRVSINLIHAPNTWEKGITHMRKDRKLCSGNLSGWIQYRHLLDNNTCEEYNHEERIKSF